jgi:ketosteroid isomerase-like protein
VSHKLETGRRRRWALLLALLPGTASGESTAQNCQPEAAEVREIRAVASGIVDADNRRDIERVLAYYSADAVLMPPGAAPVVGRDSIRPRYETLFASVTPEIETWIDEACVAGGMGFVRGRNGGRLTPLASGEVRALDDAYLMLLRREAGVWRISHLIWHGQGAPAPAAARAEGVGRAKGGRACSTSTLLGRPR